MMKILCFGGGVNTIALLLEATSRGIIFDAILFSDPGSEKMLSYEYTKMMNKWCVANGQPQITTLKQVNAAGDVINLYDDVYNRNALPGIVYGFKSCSLKFKRYPQDKFMNNWSVAQAVWAGGDRIEKWVGYDVDESHRTYADHSDAKYLNVYPLVEWNWGRMECVKRIIDSGLPLPPKSSCTYCPSMKPAEIIDLYLTEPAAFYRAVQMERNAAGELTDIKGLGRDWSWWDLVVAYRYMIWFRRNETALSIIHPRIKSHAKRTERKPRKKGKKKVALAPEVEVPDMFRTSNEIPCDCYDGSA